MDILSDYCGSVQRNCFQIYKRENVFRASFCIEGRYHDIPLRGVNTNRDVVGSIKYFCELVGLNIINNSLRLDTFNFSELKGVDGNVTLATLKTKYGDLFVKKLNSVPLNDDMTNYISGRYTIFARLHGIVRLTNDPNYSVGMIMERCYSVTKMTVNTIVVGLASLMESHRLSGGILHGDCNAQNIMADRNGLLKLVDPGNIISQSVTWMNRSVYRELTVESEIEAFVLSCFIIISRLRDEPLDDITVPLISKILEFNTQLLKRTER